MAFSMWAKRAVTVLKLVITEIWSPPPSRRLRKISKQSLKTASLIPAMLFQT
uniref:Uncharacterized protein n=1 Tax=Rhizophora mucronata TaxID=61149 RepID=A0A2P2Q9E5_RHIMU